MKYMKAYKKKNHKLLLLIIKKSKNLRAFKNIQTFYQ